MADDVIRIVGVHPTIDGEYPFTVGVFTNRDFHDIKRIANIRAREIAEAFKSGDTDLIVAFAVIALRHAGKTIDEDALWDAPMGKIQLFAGDEAEVDDLPPASAPPSDPPSEPVGDAKQSGATSSSGASSSNGSGDPGNGQSPTGPPASDIGAMSVFETSAK